MTHPNHQTNGASLEDCHTNFFALTELCGIKWRKLVWGECGGGGADGEPDGGAEDGGGGGVLEDPVLSAYARCLAAGVLCVWRRASAAQSAAAAAADPFELTLPALTAAPAAPPLSLRAAKELWIFWYGDEPDLSALVPQELRDKDSERGSWEVGLSYECRSLLFKALHNLIERCLLSRNFVRLGKWFVQPYDGDKEDDGKSCWHLSFSFAFFVHGESTVCASVDVRQHPPVRTLTSKRLSSLSTHNRTDGPQRRDCFHSGDTIGDNTDQPQTKVILAPFGLEGILTGRIYSAGDPSTTQLSNAWRQFYPVSEADVSLGCIEVIAGGVRMRYPQQYVLLTDMDEEGRLKEGTKGPPPAPAVPPFSQHLPDLVPDVMAEKCYRDVSFVAQYQEPDTPDKIEWDFVDPMRKVNCTCSNGCSDSGLCGNGSISGGLGLRGSPPSLPGSPGVPQAMSAPPSVPSIPPSDSTLHPHSNQAALPTLHTPAASPDPMAPPTPRTPNQYHQTSSSYSPGQPQSSSQWNGTSNAQENQTDATFPKWASGESLKRPLLAVLEKEHDPLDDDHSLDMLYDYSTMHAWLNHPVKKFKGSEPLLGWDEGLGLGGAPGDLYAGHAHTKMAPIVDRSAAYIKLEIKQEPINDENKNLFTSDGLQASYKDLDRIFDNSDDAASGDEALQVHTPPDSNKSTDEMTVVGGGRGGNIGRVRPEELCKMFPTPPSLEQHPQPSPGYTLNDSDTQLQLQPCLLRPGSPADEPIEDWSYVFKPPTVCKYVGSSKYAPLATLPSQLLPPVGLPPGVFYRPSWQTNVTLSGSDGIVKIEQRESPIRHSPSPILNAPPSQNRAPPYSTMVSPVVQRNLPTSIPRLRADALLLNVLLADTALNVFRDHNFDSCTLCVCNAGAKVVGNIRGADACTYLTGNSRNRSDRRTDPAASPYDSPSPAPSPAPPTDDEPIHCTCGFSAIVNRRLAHRAGLFYEDEMEITGLADDPAERRKDSGVWSRIVGGIDGAALLEAVREQCHVPSGTTAALARAARDSARDDAAGFADEMRLNLLEFADGGDAAALALAAAAGAPVTLEPKGTVHRWPFIGGKGPRSSRDVFRVMRRLRPLLQRAVRNDCRRDTVMGPLTWRQFHRLAGRGEDLCEPQPVPLLIVGHDRDWLTLSPYALHYWDRLLLEPYSYARDVAYLVVAPDSEAILPQIRGFFKELSSSYETCRLGRHTPLTRISRDGLIRVSRMNSRVSSNSGDSSEDDWLGPLPDTPYCELLKAYSSTIRTVLVPQLASLSLDRSLLEPENRTPNASLDSMPPPSTPDHPPTPNSQSDIEGESLNNSGCNNSNNTSVTTNNVSITGNCGTTELDDDDAGIPAIVIYVLEPSAVAGGGTSARRVSCAALLRTTASLSQALPDSLRPAITIQLIALDAACELVKARPHRRRSDEMRAVAQSVFLQTRRYLVHQPTIKSLTGFGTAANADIFLKTKDEKNRQPYKLYGPAYVLAPPKVLRDVAESFGGGGPAGGPRPEACSVLYISYCLSADQNWLLAAATDSRGELLETVTINVAVPGRARRRRPVPLARRLGLTKLMDFILGVMSNHVQPWRLVVGRVGRIGHGELKGWSWLLSRKNLLRASTTLRDVCRSCGLLYPSGAPCILSACLVSTEPDSALRLMADRFTPDERFSTSTHSQLHTPRDVSCTHILVFPTSARAQSSQKAFQEEHINGIGDDDLFSDLNDDMGDNDFSDIFMQSLIMPSPVGSPTGNGGGGGTRGGGGGATDAFDGSEASGSEASAAPAAAPAGSSPSAIGGAAPEDVGQLLQQPLALGYLVSTAPLCAMPAWWWASGPHLQDACPCFIKNALHLHSTNVQQTSDDILLSGHAAPSSQHPLDSHTTTDVLRYVLEGYNALSWLAMDSNTHDRLSCLPVHVQVLMQMYHTAAAVI